MSDTEPPPPIELPPPPPVPPPTAEMAGPAAQASLGAVATNLNRAMAGVASGRTVAESWSDEFWQVSGYEKAAVLAAFDQLDALVEQYNNEYKDDADVLLGQS